MVLGLVSIAVIYVLVMIYLRVGVRLVREDPDGHPRRRHPERAGWPEFARQLAGTFVGGWLLLMVVVVGYFGGLARHNFDFVKDATTGTLSLMAVVYPLFLGLAWVRSRIRARWPGTGPGAGRRRGSAVDSGTGHGGDPANGVVSWERQKDHPDHPNR
ncbi:DUF6256 family protein [Streptomyces hainanensis]|uniref:Uncharacterized protein n=1 Tax=Streptomyces hainanensis TaxID=402648 RepID=A0A4R4SUS7_9ACTN|nr:DUF6256 family protein [Streptomyces hainanensis]TDC67928.1 hypothetical protein E1283_28110 [Streptomyces hainanensis]